MVEALQALRGVQFTVAITTVVELGDLTRFDTPRQFMSYLGLTPSEYSSGNRRRLGGITKTGNGHARRVLIETAKAYRHRAKVSEQIQARQPKLAKAICDFAWRAQVRLCGRYRRLLARGKHPNTVAAAIARELAAFMWALPKPSRYRRSRERVELSVTRPEPATTPILGGRRRAGDGATLVSVTRLRQTLVSRPRQAPDEHKQGGTQPTSISMINRRGYWLRLFRGSVLHDL